MSTTNVPAYKSCFLDSGNPNVSYASSSSLYAKNGEIKRYSLVGFRIPESVKPQDITAAEIYVYGYKESAVTSPLKVCQLSNSFNQNGEAYDYEKLALAATAEITDILTAAAYKGKAISITGLNLPEYALTTDDANEYTFSSSIGSNAPYLLLTHSAKTPMFSESTMSPNSGGIFTDKNYARNSEITFKWNYFYLKSGVMLRFPMQKSAKLRYRVAGAGTYTEISITGNVLTYKLPANTLTTNASEWQIVVVDENDQTATSEWMAFNTPIGPSAPTILYPQSAAIDTTRDNVFAWKHNYTVAQHGAQIKFDYGYKTEIITVGSTQSYAAPKNSIAWGTLLKWSVRTQSNGVYGEWSEAQNALLSPLPAPVVSFSSATPKPTINFSYTGYGASKIWYAFRVKCGDYDSGVLTNGTTETVDGSTVTSSLDLPVYLNAGSQTAQVQCCDASGKWSAWAQATATIVNTPLASIVMSAAQSGNAVSLSWGENSAFTAYYVSRDNVMIGKDATGAYTDNFAGMGEHVYKVRGVDGTNYADSNEVTVNVTVSGAWLAPIDTIEWVSIGLKAGNEYGFGRDVDGSVVYNQYDGNTSASILDQKTIKNSFAISVMNYADRKKVESMINKTVCVKTSRGDVIFGVLDKAGNSIKSVYTDLTLSVGEITYSEAISYE